MGVLGMGDGVGCLATKKKIFFQICLFTRPDHFWKKIFFYPLATGGVGCLATEKKIFFKFLICTPPTVFVHGLLLEGGTGCTEAAQLQRYTIGIESTE